MPFNYKTAFSTPFFEIEEGIDSNNLTSEPYYRMTGVDSVICCVMTLKGEFVMIKQYRPNINEISLELPAGGLLDNEKPLDAAKREFAEETSLICDFISLGDHRLMMNRTNIKEHIYFGINPEKSNEMLQESGIEVHLIDRKKLSKLAITGFYKQLAGLGVIQLASSYLELNILSDPMEEIYNKFKLRQDYEC
jgi:ADP-ribose pyrophosphatase